MVARWESPRGKYWIELFKDEKGGYTYRSTNGGGVMGTDRAATYMKLYTMMDNASLIDGIRYHRSA
jgi:hypothetical protein